ncbi:MAG TPA: alpha-amylase/4-alpha-glucanotransferase domain-containing protein, partial [Nitrososphaerales archaeon]|nr:alpha-amylase/4-alpha-glucanotransferase domain-containing protein [Nitrososphaerales archaeon]
MSADRKIRLAFVIHNHQPVGNPNTIVERIYRTSYFPFIKKLVAYPQIKTNIHYTGFLLEWLENHHPEFIGLLRRLVDRGQIEFVGGAYYEPVISVIPDSDAIGQNELLSEKIRSLFGVDPAGFWTAERAWEPNLPEILTSTKSGHTVIDDVSFESSGLDESDCFEPYLVESRGNFVTVFPILKKLRYYIPFKPVATSIAFLRDAALRNFNIAVYADDGEKFGAWPSTFDRVYKEGWLESFLKTIAKQNWIETVKLSEYLKSYPATKRIYLPASTYSEMMEWAIPLNNKLPSLRRRTNDKNNVPLRGFWRLFLAKYPESANIYSKMLRVSKSIHSLGVSNNREALVNLWKGQCNDAYWHGVFGGLYAPILRRITYDYLIRANVGYEKLRFGSSKNWIYAEESSNNGNTEIHVETEKLGLTIFPSSGGAISGLDFK